MIVEDEAVIARRLARMLAELEPRIREISVVAELAAASKALASRKGDLLLLDLNLHGCDGFDLLRHGLAAGWRTIVVSAHIERAIEAFELGVVDFIPKPFTLERLRLALERAFGTAPNGQLRYLAAFFGTGTVLIPLDEVMAIHGADDYSEIETVSGQRYLHGKSLQELCAELPATFVRVHRSHIANLRFARSLARTSGGWRLLLKTGSSLAVGRQALAEVRKRLL
jgi:two-component system, LytTR family, response regulator LytT